MADWIKVEVNSFQKIEVLTMADILDMSDHEVFGKLVVLWCWADANTIDGNALGVTKKMINRVVCNDKFADAMLDERVKWLKEDENGNISFPNFDRHNGRGAKKRASNAKRVQQHRENVTISEKKCNTQSVTETLEKALPDKIREDKIYIYNVAKEIDAEKVLSVWNNLGCKKHRSITKAAKSAIEKTYKEYAKSNAEPLGVTEWIVKYLQSGFAKWMTNHHREMGDGQWAADLEFAVRFNTYDKVRSTVSTAKQGKLEVIHAEYDHEAAREKEIEEIRKFIK